MRAYSRRHRAWQRRYGQPIMLIPTESRLLILLAALGRMVYRHRSALAPFATAGALYLAALLLHSDYASQWPWILAATVGLAVLTVVRGAPWGVDRVEERIYATTATAAAGTWLTIATAVGPWRGPLATILWLAAVGFGVPWWVHRRRRARVRVDRAIQAWPDIAESIGLTGSRVMSAVVDVWGWRARLHLTGGQTVHDVIAKVPAIESGLGTRPGAVRVEADPAHAARLVMRVLAEDPHAGAIPWTGPSIHSITEPIDLGVFEDAAHVRLSVLRRHVLIGGTTDSGKSGVLNIILGNLTACPDVVLWGIDLKGGMELRPWASCLARLATTPTEATSLLRDGVRILEARANAMSHTGSRTWTPSPTTPALVIIVDEYAELVEQAPTAVEYAESIARRGRAIAVTLLAATQRPTQKAMGGGALRSQMSVRICLRVRERRDVDLILDKGMLTTGWHAHTLDAPGKFYLLADGHNQPRRARAYLVTDNDVHAASEQHAPTRPTLDTLSHNAIDIIDAEIVDDRPSDPEITLTMALRDAPSDGLTVPELMDFTGKGRTWVYDRLQALASTGRAHQVSRGRWKAGAGDAMPD